jgi:phospholipid transport system transporter-binding protein
MPRSNELNGLRAEQDRLAVRGPMLMDNARALLESALAQFRSPQTVIDLSAASDIDSSAVALLLELKREAQRRNVELKVVNAPASVQSLAQLYGVSELL